MTLAYTHKLNRALGPHSQCPSPLIRPLLVVDVHDSVIAGHFSVDLWSARSMLRNIVEQRQTNKDLLSAAAEFATNNAAQSSSFFWNTGAHPICPCHCLRVRPGSQSHRHRQRVYTLANRHTLLYKTCYSVVMSLIQSSMDVSDTHMN